MQVIENFLYLSLPRNSSRIKCKVGEKELRVEGSKATYTVMLDLSWQRTWQNGTLKSSVFH